MSKIREKVFQAIGEASMCWSPLPETEIFDSEKAKQIAENLLEEIESEFSARKEAWKKELLEKLPKEKPLIKCSHDEIAYECESCARQNEFIKVENYTLSQIQQIIENCFKWTDS